MDVLADDALNVLPRHAVENRGAHMPAALDKAMNLHLAPDAPDAREALFLADKSFVGFDVLSRPAKRLHLENAHGFAQAVPNDPAVLKAHA